MTQLALVDQGFIEFLSGSRAISRHSYAWLLQWHWGPNSGPHVCTVSPLPTETRPSLCSKKLKKSNENYLQVNEQGQEGTLQRQEEENQGEREAWTGLNVGHSITGV